MLYKKSKEANSTIFAPKPNFPRVCFSPYLVPDRTATVYGEGGTSRTIFYPFSGVTEELKAFFRDISGTSKEQEPRLSYVEGARDVAVLEAMLESGARNGAVIPVKKF
ncbi:hypothetical protein F2Q69_00030919 [Brassica cretica]|uniref:Gfo/Idh/MocA-like oxidoreductase C-terminal domain-containing protein n=1 Tax=Brassica cretica TaxID=69181 RepID=A0A8S9S1P5_BRACR|nr:hypothetical protein F2Q69_00030919 [Brassica cretica]